MNRQDSAPDVTRLPGASCVPGMALRDFLSMIPLEIEVKFYLQDRHAVRQRILDAGASISHPNCFERNLRFDDAQHCLSYRNSVLRLRQDETAKLTFKSKPLVRDKEFKIFQELEVLVSNFDTMKQILESLGFIAYQTYEKYRETFALNECELCLDVMPYGSFLEIEGGKEQIRQMADRLGLKWEKRILRSYLAIFADMQAMLNLPFSDLTFDNFKTIDLDFSKYCSVFEA